MSGDHCPGCDAPGCKGIQEAPASGRDLWVLKPRMGEIDTLLFSKKPGWIPDLHLVHVREVTPKDAEQEAAVQELVKALKKIDGPGKQCTDNVIANEALAKWEKIK